MSKKPGLLDLETHFAFYGAYHSNPINVMIHILFVWPILFTTLMLFHFTPPILDAATVPKIGSLTDFGLVVNFGFFFALFYALFYVVLDNKAGSLAAFLVFACWVGACLVSSKLGWCKAWRVVLAAQLFCWTGQFLGHGVFEKRAPALIDNLAQALLTAPFFVFLEVIQTVFGYEPYPGFHERVKAKTEAEIKQWKANKENKST